MDKRRRAIGRWVNTTGPGANSSHFDGVCCADPSRSRRALALAHWRRRESVESACLILCAANAGILGTKDLIDSTSIGRGFRCAIGVVRTLSYSQCQPPVGSKSARPSNQLASDSLIQTLSAPMWRNVNVI